MAAATGRRIGARIDSAPTALGRHRQQYRNLPESDTGTSFGFEFERTFGLYSLRIDFIFRPGDVFGGSEVSASRASGNATALQLARRTEWGGRKPPETKSHGASRHARTSASEFGGVPFPRDTGSASRRYYPITRPRKHPSSRDVPNDIMTGAAAASRRRPPELVACHLPQRDARLQRSVYSPFASRPVTSAVCNNGCDAEIAAHSTYDAFGTSAERTHSELVNGCYNLRPAARCAAFKSRPCVFFSAAAQFKIELLFHATIYNLSTSLRDFMWVTSTRVCCCLRGAVITDTRLSGLSVKVVSLGLVHDCSQKTDTRLTHYISAPVVVLIARARRPTADPALSGAARRSRGSRLAPVQTPADGDGASPWTRPQIKRLCRPGRGVPGGPGHCVAAIIYLLPIRGFRLSYCPTALECLPTACSCCVCDVTMEDSPRKRIRFTYRPSVQMSQPADEQCMNADPRTRPRHKTCKTQRAAAGGGGGGGSSTRTRGPAPIKRPALSRGTSCRTASRFARRRVKERTRRECERHPR
ncbi:hypothetical protein EVAR_93081_1 [Eumeta japonica]|uniref:Uncharacterized protein n=1 Tax=Eumeta variegata TaxID=151549 RepID=A0A4C1TF30_EUMVA|nr:hypothetical protein EVAR_93081_1 [Eumeta japonica]